MLAGLAVTVSASVWLPEGLRTVRPEEGLPPLPDYGIQLVKSREAESKVTDALAAHLEESCRLDARLGRAA